MNVLVTDGDSRAALAVTRSLGRQGHRVVVGEQRAPALAHTSRFCADRVQYPAPFANPAGFVDALARIVAEHRIDVLLPVADVPTLLVTAHRDRFEPSCQVPFASHETLARAADKGDLVQTARRLGVPVPATVVLDRREELDRHLSQLTFPVVVKPHRSRVPTAAGWQGCTVGYAQDPVSLAEELRHRDDAQYPLLLQERIEGPGIGVFVCYEAGSLVALFGHRRLREKPPWGGVSVLAESIAVPPHARRYAEALFANLKWQGVGMAEFKVDRRDGLPKLMEINGRFWGSLQLAVDAGVDFPAILVEACRGRVPFELPRYETGVRNRWFWGDVDSLATKLFGRSPERKNGSSGMRAVADFLRLWEPGLYYDNPKPSDVRPWVFETWQRVRRSA
jgi:predicted ATP-grasp superfamily ATP-dependent carboligase